MFSMYITQRAILYVNTQKLINKYLKVKRNCLVTAIFINKRRASDDMCVR